MNINDTYYDIYEFRYKNKNNLPLLIYARNEEIADQIVFWWNKDLEKNEQWYKPRFFFKKKKCINVEPYPFEREQLESAKELYEHRMSYIEKHKNDFDIMELIWNIPMKII